MSPLIDFLGDHLDVHGMNAAFRMIGMGFTLDEQEWLDSSRRVA